MPEAERDVGSIQNRHLSAIVQTYLDDEKLMEISAAPPQR